MPQVDLVPGVSDGKVSFPDDLGDSPSSGLPDYAPESFWLSKDAEYDWFDRNALFERKESINSHSAALPPLHPGSNSSSQRFSVNIKSKPSIIGLPKTQKTAFAEAKNRKNVKPSGNTRLFPNRPGSAASKPDPAAVEPGSPKVSCMGRVRSKRDRNRRMRNGNRQVEPVSANKGIMSMSESSERHGLLSSLRAMFRSRRRRRSGRKEGAPSVRIVRDIRERLPAAEALRSESVRGRGRDDGDAPSLGGMKRFVSGRRSDSWAGDVA
ncbi:hypothetical protein MLD38_026638 [Melastoma candidum]|uniref:Uncharacterized protein n=1 Tax=Melastoma candidum TaxID=119954 RepID=A0ACB9P479_9MYRT|nr:hypothetical protein MLD38_026638 [Melastoma candidum]